MVRAFLVVLLATSASGLARAQASIGSVLPIWEDDLENFLPAVVYNELHDEFLVVWCTAQGPTTMDLFARRFGIDGSLGSWFAVRSEAGVSLFWPSVAYSTTHDQYLVAWARLGSDYDIEGRRIRWDGGELHPPFPIVTGTGDQLGPQVVFNAIRDEYLVAYFNSWPGQEMDVAAQRIQAGDNSLLSWATVATGPDRRVDVALAFNPRTGKYLISYLLFPSGGAQSVVGKIAEGDLSGVSLAPELLFVPPDGNTNALAATCGDTGCLLVFSRENTVRAQTLADDGTITGPTHGNRISWLPISTDPVEPAAVHVRGGEYLAVWDTAASTSQSDIVAATIWDEPGGPYSWEFLIEDRPEEQTNQAVACAGTRCLVVWADDWNSGAGGDSDIAGRFIDLPLFADGFESGTLDAWSGSDP